MLRAGILLCAAVQATARAQAPAEEQPPLESGASEAPEPGEGTQPSETSEGVEEEPEPTAEELAAIERALAADAGEREPEEDGGEEDEDENPVASAIESLNPDLSLVSDVALAWFSHEDEALQTGGHDPTENGFNLQQVELSFNASVDPYFRFDANIVFALFGVEVEEAYATTLDLPGGFQARAGQFLTRFGRINDKHPHAWDFVDQPFAIGRVFGGEGNRGLGVEVSWLSPLPWYLELVASGTMAAGEGTARSFFGANDLGVDDPRDLEYVAAIKQFWPLGDDWSLFVGLSGAFGPNPTGRHNRTDVYGADVYLKFRPISEESSTIVSLTTEWIYRRRQIPAGVLDDLSGYAQLFWRFAKEWGAAARYELGTPASSIAGADYLDPDWTENRHRAALNLTFWPTEFSRFRLQGSIDFPLWLDHPIVAGFFAAEFVTGAHGAHEF
jgi:hypothetical protein